MNSTSPPIAFVFFIAAAGTALLCGMLALWPAVARQHRPHWTVWACLAVAGTAVLAAAGSLVVTDG